MINQIVATMLTENTGRALLDSGGAYGRNWEQNQGKDFDRTPPYSLEARTWVSNQDVRKLELTATIDLYHWMDRNFKYCPTIDRALQRAIKAQKNEDKYEMEIMQDFAKQHGTGEWPWEKVQVTNTYNHDCDLSQTIQYVAYSDPEYGSVYLIQVHGGCDVRGGYTSPKAFTCSEDLVNLQVSELEAGPYAWYCDGTYRTYPEEAGRDVLDFSTMPVIDQEDLDNIDLTVVEEPSIIVFEKKAYVVTLESTTPTGMTDLFTGEPTHHFEWVAHELQIAD